MRKSSSISLLLGVVAASQLGATDCGEVISDPGFDLWCGEQLCSWKIARGEVDQVPTWHAGDDGVELLGTDAAIYQLAPVTSADGACLDFELLADVDVGVDLRFQVDVFGDGSIELDEQIPSADWRPLSYRFHIDGAYQGVKFWIVKNTAGHAVVAQLQARICEDPAAPGTTISGLPAPAGARCGVAADCATGICESIGGPFPPPETCGACEIGSACPEAGDVCGLALPAAYTLTTSTACVPTASKQLGELCAVNPECADGLCVFGVCSTCWDTSCSGGESCDVAARVPRSDGLGDVPVPFVCSPAGGLRAQGEPCFADGDCTSGQCAGTPRTVCDDGRPCANDGDCPIREALEHGTCATVGVLGGTCQ
jgi:hypothetical protein